MRSKSLLVLIAVLCVVAVSGCNVPRDTMFDRYHLTTLNVSTSADVVSVIQGKGEKLTKGENAIASWGDEKKKSSVWFNAVAFDDETSNAVRKYGFVATPKWHADRMRFEAELVIDPDVANEPYANENARKIAVLKSILKDFSNDLAPLESDGKTLQSGSLMVKQLLEKIIYDLNASPALAGDLNENSGMDFDNMSLGKGKAKMVIVNGVVNLKTKTGFLVSDFKEKSKETSKSTSDSTSESTSERKWKMRRR